jgi:hypothetical protein
LFISYFKKISSNLLRVIIFISIALVATEITLKYTVGKPWVNSHKYSQDYGWVNKPGTQGWYLSEGKSYVNINSYGFNDDEPTIIKPKNIYRIVVIGDSYVEALQVSRSTAFYNVLETKLNLKCNLLDKNNIEVIAFGVSGWGPAQELLLLEKLVLNFDPDLVMVIVTTTNDIRNSSPVLETYKNRPFVLEKNNLIIWDYSLVRAQNNFLKVDVVLIEELHIYKWARLLAISIKNIIHQLTSPSQIDAYLPPESNQVWADAWKSTFIVLAEMHNKVAERGNPIIFVLGTDSEQLSSKKLINSQGLNKEHRLYTPNKELIRFFKHEKMLYFDILENISGLNWKENFRNLHGSPPRWWGHWNSQGHATVAKNLLPYVCSVMKRQNQVYSENATLFIK